MLLQATPLIHFLVSTPFLITPLDFQKMNDGLMVNTYFLIGCNYSNNDTRSFLKYIYIFQTTTLGRRFAKLLFRMLGNMCCVFSFVVSVSRTKTVFEIIYTITQ